MINYYLRQMVNSAVRNRMVHLLILCCLSISLTFLSIIFSTFQAGMGKAEEKAEKVMDNAKFAQFQRVMAYERYSSLSAQWAQEGLTRDISSMAEKKHMVSVEGRVENVTVVGVEPSYFTIFDKDSKLDLDNDTVVMTSALAATLYPSPEAAVGRQIELGGTTFTIGSIRELGDAQLYIIAGQFHRIIPGEFLSGMVFVPTSSDSSMLISERLAEFQPMITDWIVGHNSLMNKYRLFFTISLIMGIMLFSFALLSYAYMYTYKMIRDQFKWKVFYIHGAQKSHMFGYILCEMMFTATIAALLASGILQLFQNSGWISRTGLEFRYEWAMLLKLFLVTVTILSLFIVLIYRYVQKRIYPREA